MQKVSYPLLIIGAGPAGYTAAIYAARAGLNPVLYQGAQPGGQLILTTDVENYPGYPKGVQGPKMMLDFQQQAVRFGTILRSATISSVDFSDYPYQCTTSDEYHIKAKAIIIATGATAKYIGLPNEKKLYGKGVSTCAVCDGFFFKQKDVAVIGGGDTAAEEALYLSNICHTVYMLVRRDCMRASVFLQKKIVQKKNIQVCWNTEVENIHGDNSLTSITVRHNRTNEQRNMTIHGLFVAIGHTPNTTIFKSYIDMDNHHYIKTIPGTTKTNKPGIFAAGDVQDPIYRQAVTAAATGCMAALDAERFLVQEN